MRALHLFIFVVALFLSSCKSNKILKTEVVTLAETSISWNGDELPKYPDGSPKITILKITIPPHSKLKVHKHLVINAGVLLKGELTVVDEYNNTLLLKTGDAIVELVNTWHYGENKSNQPAEIIVFYAGNLETPITVIKNNSNTKNTH